MAQELRNSNDWDSAFGNRESEIQWEVGGNPKRPGFKAHDRFEKYFKAETVGAYLDAGGSRGDLRYDWEHKFLTIIPKESDLKTDPKGDEVESEAKAEDKTEAKAETKPKSTKQSSKAASKSEPKDEAKTDPIDALFK